MHKYMTQLFKSGIIIITDLSTQTSVLILVFFKCPLFYSVIFSFGQILKFISNNLSGIKKEVIHYVQYKAKLIRNQTYTNSK